MLPTGALHLQTVSGLGMAAMALLAIAVRARAADKPLNAAKIVMPPIGMSTGFLMFVSPLFHISWTWALIALLVGAVFFSYPLIRSSKLERRGGQIYMKRSKSFMFVLLTLLSVRILLHSYIEQWVSIPQTGALFFILAFGMLVPWRLTMLLRFRRLTQQTQQK